MIDKRSGRGISIGVGVLYWGWGSGGSLCIRRTVPRSFHFIEKEIYKRQSYPIMTIR